MHVLIKNILAICLMLVLFTIAEKAYCQEWNYINLDDEEYLYGGIFFDYLALARWGQGYGGDTLDIYLCVVKNPVVYSTPSTIRNALRGDAVYYYDSYLIPNTTRVLFADNTNFFKKDDEVVIDWYTLPLPNVEDIEGVYKLATLFIYSKTGKFVRTDGLPVENSGLFEIP